MAKEVGSETTTDGESGRPKGLEGMMRGWMEGAPSSEMHEGMAEGMKGSFPSREVPFYQEKTFLVVVTVGSTLGLTLVILFLVKRKGVRTARARKTRGDFVNEAIVVVDLCESTRLATIRGMPSPCASRTR